MGLLTLLEASRLVVANKHSAAEARLVVAIDALEHAVRAAEESERCKRCSGPPEAHSDGSCVCGMPDSPCACWRPPEPEWFGRFISPEQIANDVLARMSAEDKIEWREAKREELIQVHHTTGRAIRNFYGLWRPENPYTNADDPCGSTHPDQVSQRVIYLVWKRLTGEE